MYCWYQKNEKEYDLYFDGYKEPDECIANVKLLPVLKNPDSHTWRAEINYRYSTVEDGAFNLDVFFSEYCEDKMEHFQNLINLIVNHYSMSTKTFSFEPWGTYTPNESSVLAYILDQQNERIGHVSYSLDEKLFKVEITRQTTNCVFTVWKKFPRDSELVNFEMQNNARTMVRIKNFAERVYFPGMLIV